MTLAVILSPAIGVRSIDYYVSERAMNRSCKHNKVTHRKLDNKQLWWDAKSLRAEEIGSWHCEICQIDLTEQETIGHHVVGCIETGPNTVTNCRLHCAECERLYHIYLRRGCSDSKANRLTWQKRKVELGEKQVESYFVFPLPESEYAGA